MEQSISTPNPNRPRAGFSGSKKVVCRGTGFDPSIFTDSGTAQSHLSTPTRLVHLEGLKTKQNSCDFICTVNVSLMQVSLVRQSISSCNNTCNCTLNKSGSQEVSCAWLTPKKGFWNIVTSLFPFSVCLEKPGSSSNS